MTVWLERHLVEVIHDEQIQEHGGAAGLRDEALLESALARPLNLAAYGNPEPAELAATYALGIIRNHPFIDGNKRTGYVALELFLALNGMRFPVSDEDAISVVLRVAGHGMADEAFIAWVRAHAVAA